MRWEKKTLTASDKQLFYSTSALSISVPEASICSETQNVYHSKLEGFLLNVKDCTVVLKIRLHSGGQWLIHRNRLDINDKANKTRRTDTKPCGEFQGQFVHVEQESSESISSERSSKSHLKQQQPTFITAGSAFTQTPSWIIHVYWCY